MMILPIILCGGSGSRLWPLSREQNPKPFIRLKDGLSLIQHAYEKALLVGTANQIITVANKDLFFRAKSDFDELEFENNCENDYILEPEGRNTAPAIAMAAIHAQKKYGDNVCILVLAADHLIEGDEAFISAIQQATQLASQDKLVTFGIKPTKPETGYGYIQYEANSVKKFVEKPDLQTAQAYVDSQQFLWNSGMFCFKPSTFLAELQQYRPEMFTSAQQAYQQANQEIFEEAEQINLVAETFGQLPDESVDYAVMENSKKVAVVPCDFSWNDVGSWDSLADAMTKSQENNVVIGETLLKDVNNSMIFSKERLIAGIGFEDLIVIDTDDAILIVNRSQSQDVKKIYNELKAQDHDAYKIHTTAHRPWGTYTILDEANGYKVKRIVVYPGAKLSLQHHHHRSEHWIVVAGKAEVVNGEQTLQLSANQSTYIKQGDIHRLINVGEENLVLIEVQCGDYLGEDDIVRHQDDYART